MLYFSFLFFNFLLCKLVFPEGGLENTGDALQDLHEDGRRGTSSVQVGLVQPEIKCCGTSFRIQNGSWI